MNSSIFLLLLLGANIPLNAGNEIDLKISSLFAFKVEPKDLEDDFKNLSKDCEEGLAFLLISEDIQPENYHRVLEFANKLKWNPPVFLENNGNVKYSPKPLSIGSISNDEKLKIWCRAYADYLRNQGFSGLNMLFPGLVNKDIQLELAINEDWEVVEQKSTIIQKEFQGSQFMNIIRDYPGFLSGRESALRIDLEEDRIKNIELKAYQSLIDKGADLISVSNALVRKDKESYEPFFLSEYWIEKVLLKDLKYEGLIISGNVKETSEWYDARNGEMELEALMTGNHIILNPENTRAAKRRIRNELKRNKKFNQKFETALEKTKGLKKDTRNDSDYNENEIKMAYENLNNASTIVFDRLGILPLENLELEHFASVEFKNRDEAVFTEYLTKYAQIKFYQFPDRFDYDQKFNQLIDNLEPYSTIFVNLGNVEFNAADSYGLGSQVIEFIEKLAGKKKLIIRSGGNPKYIDLIPINTSIVHSFENQGLSNQIAAQIIYGARGAEATLPISLNKVQWNAGDQIKTLGRLSYAYPEEVGMNSMILSKVDDVVNEALITKATPGCQLLVAKDGKIVLEKSYGYLSYDSLYPVQNSTIYDIASLTKAAATLQAVMFLAERDIIDLNSTASRYLVELRNSNKDDLFISDILAHQAGLTPYIPHWKKTLDENGLDENFYCDNPDDWFCNEVIPGIYSIRSMEDSLWQWTINSELRAARKDGTYSYRYSDLGFYIMKKLVERQTRQSIESFLDQNFYQPIGTSRLTFFPLAHFDLEEIAPTERDEYFRNTTIRGVVHDQGAAMLGGVGGHAGLFSNSLELAKIMQMNLNGGEYGGKRYLQESTLKTFTERHFKNNRRGLGWDKPLRSGNGPSSDLCSYSTFGHTGFTGTSMWADPEYGLIFVFLSNRIHPDANNRELIKQNIRTRIQDIVYESIFVNDLNKANK